MALAATTQIIQDGARNTIIKFTGVSDGNGESAVLKVDVSALLGAPSDVRIARIDYSMYGLQVRILWDASTDVLAWLLTPEQDNEVDFMRFGGLVNNAGTGKTGDILFTTEAIPGVALASGASYSIVLEMIKQWSSPPAPGSI